MDSPQPPITYARARLYLGITGVGTGVGIAIAGLALDWPAQLAGTGNGLARLLAGYVLLSLPFDLLGGYVLPRWFGRPTPALIVYLAGLFRAQVLHAGFLWLAATAILASGQGAGLRGVLAVASLGMALLLLGRPLVATLIAGQRRKSEMSAFRLRAAAQNGSRLRGILVACGWNLAGIAAAAWATGADLTQEAGVITLAFGFSLWSFLGLLLLPSVSRPAVLATDQALLARGITRAALESYIVQTDRELDDEPDRAKWIERIFHPIPSVAVRLAALERRTDPGWGADEAARLTLYLSWASLGLLSRAVHCNSGKPEYWVYLPRD